MIPLCLWLLILPGNYDFEAHLEVIQDCPSMDSSHVGYAGMPSSNHAEYKILFKKASKAQLLSAMDHASPMVRAFINQAFFERYPMEWLPMGIDHLDDHATITTMEGCMVETLKLSKLYFGWLEKTLTALLEEEQTEQSAGIFSTELKLKILDHLFSQEMYNRNLARVLGSWDLPDAYYEKVRNLAQKQSPEALVALARYQNAHDANLIRSYLEGNKHLFNQNFNALTAATILPHPSYTDVLTQIHKRMLSEEYHTPEQYALYKALISNRLNKAPVMMLETIQAAKEAKITEFQLQHMHRALADSQDLDVALFQDVLFELWLSMGYLENHHFDQLWSLDPVRCTDTLGAIANQRSPWISSYGYKFSPVHVAKILLAAGEHHLETLNQMIDFVNIFDLPSFMPAILESQSSSTLPHLLARLEKTHHETVMKWMIIGIRHLEPKNYKKIVHDLIAQYPEWQEPNPHWHNRKKASAMKFELKKAKKLAKAVKKRQDPSP